MFCSSINLHLKLSAFSATEEVSSSKVSWNLPASVAKSFLTSRHKRSDPRCDNVEGFCEHNKQICMQYNENSREIRCTPTSCLPTQTCYLATPCPSHWQIGCTACFVDDQCLSFPCSNGGACHDLTGSYRCNCIPGWDEATDCRTDKNECLSAPCQNGGSCTDKWADFSCHCTKRFNGTTCEKVINGRIVHRVKLCDPDTKNSFADCRPGHADITFIVDTSSSQENDINRTIEFISKFVNKLPMGKNDYQFSVITYGFTAQVLFDFNDFSSKSDILEALKQIHGMHSPTYTKLALMNAVDLAKSTTSGSRLTNASHYIILLYDGLSSDRHDAEDYAISLNLLPVYHRPIRSVMAVAVGRSVDHSEMIMLSNKPELTFDLLHFDDIYNKILKDTAHKDCTDCTLHKDTDMIILQDISSNQTSVGFRTRQEAIRRIIEKIVRYNADAHIGLYSYADNISQVFPLSWSNNTDKMVATALQVDRKKSLYSNLSYALNQLHLKGFSSLNGARSSNRKIIAIVSNGKWQDSSNIKREINLLQQSYIEVVGVVAGQDCLYDNFVSVVNDPSQVYYVANNDFTSLESLAGMTSYYKCDDDIFIKLREEVVSSKVSWNLPASVAKSFLTSRHKRSDPRCGDNNNEFCVENIPICMYPNENSREHHCKSTSCIPTQTCYLTSPRACPDYWNTGCSDDQCLSFPCYNGGTCHDLTGNHRCNCSPGWDEATDCRTDCRPGHADITFIVDTSSSQENDINRTVEFISKFVNKLPMGKNDYQFSVITYGFKAQVLFDFNDLSSKTDIFEALKKIYGKHSPTYTKLALSKAVEIAQSTTSGSRLTKASHHIILLYDGLSSDRYGAKEYVNTLNRLPLYRRPIRSIMTVAVGRSIDHSEMINISNKPEYTFDLLHFDDIYNKILRDTSHRDCTVYSKVQHYPLDCAQHTDTDIIILQDINMNQTYVGFRARQEAIRRIIEKVVRYNADAHIGMYSYAENISKVFSLSWSKSTDKMVATAMQVDRKRSLSSNLSYALNQLHQNGFLFSNGARSSNKKVIVIVSNGKWQDFDIIKREVNLLQQSHIGVVGVVAGQDCVYDNFVSVLFDPSEVYYVAENDYSSLESLAGMTSYYECDDDIFIKRQ
ncbi:unnamed protein product [Mytilus coruscus]|uniref:COL6A n=1 Tax=Mytilus coruscus TaxID=42192 RepID=A0A6J8BK03_MYTCO|nr:unnamed protein product [Mytilus coruscus]